jgi:hypothetical protein
MNESVLIENSSEMRASLSSVVLELISIFESDKPVSRQGYKYSVSKAISTLAVLYEKARNAVEFRAEHLVRRAAIERILKRRMLLNSESGLMAENLIVELMWAKYIDSSLVDEKIIAQIQNIIHRYSQLRYALYSTTNRYQNISWDSVMGIASTEIDEVIISARKREALTNFFYQAIRSKIQLAQHDDTYVNILTFIAVERAYAQADDALIACHLLKLIQPSWFSTVNDLTPQERDKFISNMRLISEALHDQLSVLLSRYVRKQTPPFLLIRDFFFDKGSEARKIIENKSDFERTLDALAMVRYHEIGKKINRAVVRSIIYIFLTKMVFALALEAPFDIFIAKKLSYISLAINAIFPPFLLYLVAGFQTVPGPDNTKILVSRINKIIYNFDSLKDESEKFILKAQTNRPILTAVFSVLYLMAFLISFGFIFYLLTILHFNIASQVIFIFFVTLVTFFAYRIRQSAKEYEMTERQGFFEPIADFFFLPILRAGHILSQEIAKINIFIFLFDFVLEAPLKVIFEVFEEWIRFIRTKKEEII